MSRERQEAERQLRLLGVRLPVDTVVAVVQRLQNGDSLYSLYKDRANPRSLVSKRTAEKLRDLFQAGKLNFRLTLDEFEDVKSAIDQAASLTREEQPPSAPFRAPGGAPRTAEGLRARYEEIRPLLPRIGWTITYLEEAAGLPTETALEILVQMDTLRERLFFADAWQYSTLVRFVALHYIVRFYVDNSSGLREIPPPPELVEKAAQAYAEGLIDGNRFLRNAGEGIMRYQVWRGQSFLSAYREAQQPTLRERDRNRQLDDEIDRLIETRQKERMAAHEATKEATNEQTGQ